jgi:hypothetical protein
MWYSLCRQQLFPIYEPYELVLFTKAIREDIKEDGGASAKPVNLKTKWDSIYKTYCRPLKCKSRMLNKRMQQIVMVMPWVQWQLRILTQSSIKRKKLWNLSVNSTPILSPLTMVRSSPTLTLNIH